MTLLISRSAVEELLDLPAALAVLADGFRTATSGAATSGAATSSGTGGSAATAGPAGQRVRTELPGPGTATALLPGLLPGVPAYTVKVNAKFPAAVPALRGVVCLHSLTDGRLLALIDSAALTAWRTGLSAALGTHLLAPPRARSVAVVGAGAQSRATLRALRVLRPVDEVFAFDLLPERAAELGEVLPSAGAAAGAADIVLTATWSRAPLLGAEMLRPGLHITSLGSDEPGKAELSPALLRAAHLVVDDRQLAAGAGVLHNAGLGAQDADATLAQVLLGAERARPADGRPTVYAPIGLPWQDLALAWPLHLAAERHGLPSFDFLG